MSIIKRLSATLVSRIDQVVGEIENHDAVIQASLNDMRKKLAEAKVRLSHVRREEAQLKQQIQEQQQNAQRWRQRAIECAKSDETKALECVRRSQHCQRQSEKLTQTQAEYSQTSEKLTRDIETSEQHLSEVKQKLTLMRARQSTSSAINSTSKLESNTSHLLDDTFDRWEINISQADMELESHEIIDPIEQAFITQEQQTELRNELAHLMAEEEQKRMPKIKHGLEKSLAQKKPEKNLAS